MKGVIPVALQAGADHLALADAERGEVGGHALAAADAFQVGGVQQDPAATKRPTVGGISKGPAYLGRIH